MPRERRRAMGEARAAGLALVALFVSGAAAAEAVAPEVSRAAANYRALPQEDQAAEGDGPALEFEAGWKEGGDEPMLVQQNWVDCAEMHNQRKRVACLKALGLTGGKAKHGQKHSDHHQKKGALSSAMEKSVKMMRKMAGGATAPAKPKGGGASELAKKAQAKAEREQKLAAQAANEMATKKKQANEALAKARATIEREQKKGGPGNKWEVWYKEKVHKVNVKLHAKKKAIRATRASQIHAAKAKARAAGAHVADLGSVLVEVNAATGHHPTADQACACCHHFKKKSACYSMKCGDGSGEFCWSPGKPVGKKHQKGAKKCSGAQKKEQCQLPCVKKGKC